MNIPKFNIVSSWNEAEELKHSLSTLTDEEIIENKEALIERANKIMTLLNEFVTEEDINEFVNEEDVFEIFP